MSFNTEGSDFGIGDRGGRDEADSDAFGPGRSCVTAVVSTLRVLCNDSDGFDGGAKLGKLG